MTLPAAAQGMGSSARSVSAGLLAFDVIPQGMAENARKFASAMQLFSGFAAGYAAINALRQAWNNRQAALAAAETAAIAATGIGLKNVAIAGTATAATMAGLTAVVRTITVETDMRDPGGAMAELGVGLHG